MNKTKKIIISAAMLTPMLLVSGGAALATTSSSTPTSGKDLALGTATELQGLNVTSKLLEKDETVYLITDQAGKTIKTFVGSTLVNSDKALPVEMKITYYLNGDEISASELAGKSGHVKIKYEYTSSKYYQNKLVPFLAVTGLDLSSQTMTNLKLDNGKIVKESTDSTLVAGYSFVGLNENLNTDFLPSGFSVEADVENFELGTTYTLVTNEIFTELDTSKLNTIDEIIGQMNQLSSGLDQILSGSTELANGLDSALVGAKKLQAGASELNTCASKLASGAGTLNSGLQELSAGATKLSDGLDYVVGVDNQIMSEADAASAAIQAKAADLGSMVAEIARVNPELARELATTISELSGYYDQAYSTMQEYFSGIEQLASAADKLEKGAEELAGGAKELAGGATALADGTEELKNGSATLTDGLEQLANGSKNLNAGLSSFKKQGIDKLVNFANQDLSSFARNLRLSVEAAKSYHSYNNPSAESVKFVLKTPSISKKD